MKSQVNGGKDKPIGLYRRDVAALTAGAVSENLGGYKIVKASNGAKVGDVYRAETATTTVMVGKEYPVIESNSGDFTIASKDLPTAGDTYFILAPVTQRLGSDGAVSVTVSGGATEAKQDAEIVLIGAVNETAPASDTASSGLNGRLQRIAQRLTSLIALFPTSLGSKAAASSLAVTQSTEDAAQLGALTETAPVSDTASSGLNGRLQRIAQRITSLIALFPTALGSAAASASFAVTQSTEDIARQGIITETAPASDTASSGLNGRLQRIAQRLTTLLAVFPTTIDVNSGNKSASTLRVVLATDQPALTNKLLVTPDSVALPANQSVNVSQMNAVTVLMGAGPTGTGSQRITTANIATATLANVASSATTVTVLASAAARMGATFTNESTAILYLKFGATASLTSYTVPIPAGGYYELPQPCYSGVIDGIWSAANGNCRVTSW